MSPLPLTCYSGTQEVSQEAEVPKARPTSVHPPSPFASHHFASLQAQVVIHGHKTCLSCKYFLKENAALTCSLEIAPNS